MAQLLQIPIGFECRVFPATWTVEYGTIIRWSQDQDGNETQEGVVVCLREKTGIFIPRLNNLILPEELKAKLESRSCRNLDSLELEKLCRAHKVETLRGQPAKGTERACDAWAIRAEFFEIKQDNVSLLNFLNKWGTWHWFDSLPGHVEPSCITPLEVWDLRDTLRKALLGEIPWFGNILSGLPGSTTTGEYPFFTLRADGILSALTSTVTLDLLRRTRFKLCARKDCRQPFAIESKHPRKYCKQYCAHLESLRKQRREAKRKAKAANREGRLM
jgi:hypothetical protein